MELDEALRERARPLVEVRALDRDRRLVRDGAEQLEIALVVRVRLRALDRERADHVPPDPHRDHEDRALADGAPRVPHHAERREVAVGVAEQQRLVPRDDDTGERTRERLLRRGQLDAAIDEEPVRDDRLRVIDDRHEERVGLEDRRHLGVHRAEDLGRVERFADGVTHLDERREEPGAALGGEPGPDVLVAVDEERDPRDEEPRLDEDHLDRDHGGEAPQQLRPPGPQQPPPAEADSVPPEREEQEVQLGEVGRDEEERRGDRRRDRATGPEDATGRVHDRSVAERGDAARDRDGAGVADDLLEPLVAGEVVREAGQPGDDRDRSRRQEDDPDEDRHVRGAQVDVGVDPDGPDGEHDGQRVERRDEQRIGRGTEEREAAEREKGDGRERGEQNEWRRGGRSADRHIPRSRLASGSCRVAPRGVGAGTYARVRRYRSNSRTATNAATTKRISPTPPRSIAGRTTSTTKSARSTTPATMAKTRRGRTVTMPRAAAAPPCRSPPGAGRGSGASPRRAGRSTGSRSAP